MLCISKESVFIFFLFLLGLFAGSFASAVTYRFIIDDKYTQSYYECPACYAKILKIHSIPLISYFLILRRHCFFCYAKISTIYPVIESLTAILFVATYLVFKDDLIAFVFILFVVYCLVITSIIDLETYSVPNIFLLVLMIFGIFYCVLASRTGLVSLASGVIIFLLMLGGGKLMSVVLKRDSIGFGDVVLIPVLALFLDVKFIPYFVMLAGILGIVFGKMWHRLTGSEQFPFIPPISIAFICLSFYDKLTASVL